MQQAILIISGSTTLAGLKLAGTPLLLRTLLTAQRGGIKEILIVGGANPAASLQRDKRVRVKWSWIQLPAGKGERNELDALRRITPNAPEEFVLFFHDSVFDARALSHLRAAGLNGKAARVAVSAGASDPPDRASLYLCSRESIRLLAEADSLDSLEAFAEQLRSRGQLDSVEVAGRLWGRTTDRKQLRAIERELTHFSLKPSDGMFAKFNKLVVAEPLIRFFLHTPATPNFITGLGLLLAVGAGVAFAQGSYLWSIAGAVLAYLSAIMDHVDGMVARLKFLESEFGVWLESTADFSSYLFIFAGLAIGLFRETGFTYHLVVGGLFVFGTILSFIAMSRQRKLASADNPTDYPNRIHRKLEEKSRNVFHWFSRKFYFLTRRAVLPYFILVFCLLDLRVLLLAWVTLGANLVWILTLYNNRLFRRPAASPKAPA